MNVNLSYLIEKKVFELIYDVNSKKIYRKMHGLMQ